MKVLVVEDEKRWQGVIREALAFNDPLLVDALKERGIALPSSNQIEFADNQYTAKEIIDKEKQPFDLVILDLSIPKLPHEAADPEGVPLLGYQLVSDIRNKFGEDVSIVVYSYYLSSRQDDAIARRGMLEFLDMLRERHIAPPNEMLWKQDYKTPSLLMRKLVRYAIDLTQEDETKLREANILVPKRGATRRVLRELKRMACSASIGLPRSDVLLLGENGVGKTTFARAYHLLRPRRAGHPQLGFEHLDLGSLDYTGSAPSITLFGATNFNRAWSLGAFVRSTLYKREGSFLHFEGQELEPGYDSKSVKRLSSPGKSSYQEPSDEVDFDGCGTLFLDEVVNISFEVQAMLLQALSYDLHARHVYTTGQAPRRLRVAPSLVFATAQRLDSAESVHREDSPFRRMKDYLFRIDQMRVTIPPLRDREQEEVIQLLKVLVAKRRPKDQAAGEIDIDPIVKDVLINTLVFRNNVADLQRIADQVMPEESTISWQHVGPLFEREQPLISEIQAKRTDGSSYPGGEYARARQIHERYRNEYVNSGKKLSLSHLSRELDISRKEAYNTALIFMDTCGCSGSKRWPTDEQILQVFDHDAKAFRTYLHRISPYLNGSFRISQALRDLAELKTKDVLEGRSSV